MNQLQTRGVTSNIWTGDVALLERTVLLVGNPNVGKSVLFSRLTGKTFRQAGGEELRLIPCLNDHPVWIAALGNMVNDWLTSNVAVSAKQRTRAETLCK